MTKKPYVLPIKDKALRQASLGPAYRNDAGELLKEWLDETALISEEAWQVLAERAAAQKGQHRPEQHWSTAMTEYTDRRNAVIANYRQGVVYRDKPHVPQHAADRLRDIGYAHHQAGDFNDAEFCFKTADLIEEHHRAIEQLVSTAIDQLKEVIT